MVTTSFPIAWRAAMYAIAFPPWSSGQVRLTFGAILPSVQRPNNVLIWAAFAFGSRAAKAPQKTPQTSQLLRRVRLSGSFGMPAGKPTTR